MARKKKADEDLEAAEGQGGPADAGPRRQHTEEGEDIGIPVEEMSQTQRQEVGRLMAEEEKTFAEAFEATAPKEPEAKPAEDETK